MRHRNRIALLIFIAVAWIASMLVFVFARPILRPTDAPAEVRTLNASGSWRGHFPHPTALDLHSGARITWNVEINHPDRTPVNSAVLVAAKPAISEITMIGSPYGVTEDSLRERFYDLFSSGELALQLSIAGAKIEPDQLTFASVDNTGNWSVSFQNEGRHQGVVVPVFEGEPSDRWKLTESPTVEIVAYEPFFTAKNMLAFVGMLLGPLISIPGLYAFFRQMRKHRDEETADSPESKIIIP